MANVNKAYNVSKARLHYESRKDRRPSQVWFLPGSLGHHPIWSTWTPISAKGMVPVKLAKVTA